MKKVFVICIRHFWIRAIIEFSASLKYHLSNEVWHLCEFKTSRQFYFSGSIRRRFFSIQIFYILYSVVTPLIDFLQYSNQSNPCICANLVVKIAYLVVQCLSSLCNLFINIIIMNDYIFSNVKYIIKKWSDNFAS